MIGFDRRIVDGRGLDPEEVLKLILILAARHELGQGHRQQGPTRIRTGSETSHRHGHEDRRGFLSRDKLRIMIFYVFRTLSPIFYFACLFFIVK